MDKKLFLIVITIILLIISLGIGNYQKKLYNVYNNNLLDDLNETYNVDDEAIKFTYRFLEDWENNLTLEYLEENTYNKYSKDNRSLLENYMKEFEIVDRENNEYVLVKSETIVDEITNANYVRLKCYVSPKKKNYNSEAADVIIDGSVDANKKIIIIAYSDTPYNFKLIIDTGDEILEGKM